MPFVLTVDQIGSRDHDDWVASALVLLADLPVVLPFVRTAGDEFQGLLDQPLSVVDAILLLMRTKQWHIGLGIGAVDIPLPTHDPRSARGDCFLAARTAVEQAKGEPSHLAVASVREPAAESADVETVFRLVESLRSRRSGPGWEVADLLDQGLTHQQAADRLGVSRQAVTQRAATTQWTLDRSARPTLARLLRRADRAALVGSSR